MRHIGFSTPPAGLIAALWLAMAPAALALDPNEMFADPAREERARDIGRQLRCLVCQNQSIFDSNAALAKDLRVTVRERMQAGDDDQAILDYVASKFGDYVLLRPRMHGTTYVLWLAPVVFLLLGGAALMTYHRGRARRLAAPDTEMSAEERDEARRLLAGEPVKGSET